MIWLGSYLVLGYFCTLGFYVWCLRAHRIKPFCRVEKLEAIGFAVLIFCFWPIALLSVVCTYGGDE